MKNLSQKLLCLFFCSALLVTADEIIAQCGVPPTFGSLTVGIANNVVNTYYPGQGNPLAGANSLSVGAADSRGNAAPLAAGDLVLIIQMQGADIDASNSDAYGNNSAGAPASGYLGINLVAGNYEYNTVAGIAGPVITFSYSLANTYYDRNFTSSNSIRRYQVIRIPRYYDFRIKAGASVTCPPWNGNTGGVVALDAYNLFTLLGSIDVSYKGFRGGGGKNFTGATGGNSNGTGTLSNTDYRWNSAITNPANLTGGAKGEGIAGTPAYYYEYEGTSTTTGSVEGYIGGSMGRGAPGNGGGGATDGSPVGASQNLYNSGGGGGGNGGAGGNGGSGRYTPGGNVNTFPFGGYGGSLFSQRSIQKVCMGGGGGAGAANNSDASNEYLCSGGGGGGIVIVRAKSYAGNGSVFANGSNAPGVTDTYVPPQWDAPGGGGAGGSIIMVTRQDYVAPVPHPTGLNTITASASGGSGGDMTNSADFGPGGGGGGGIIISDGAFLSANVAGGLNGLTRTGTATGPINNSFGAIPGSAGVVIVVPYTQNLVNINNPASPCGTLPVNITNFSARWNSNTVELQWKITNEINLKSFDLEYSIDGTKFSRLTTVNYHEGVSGYNYTHLTPSLKNFYRLKMTDVDGRFIYSKILSVQKNSSGNKVLLIYPNPAYNDVTLQLVTDQSEKVAVDILDNSGRVVINKIFTLPAGRNYLSIDGIDKLPASTYLIKVKSPSVNATEKLIVGKK